MMLFLAVFVWAALSLYSFAVAIHEPYYDLFDSFIVSSILGVVIYAVYQLVSLI